MNELMNEALLGTVELLTRLRRNPTIQYYKVAWTSFYLLCNSKLTWGSNCPRRTGSLVTDNVDENQDKSVVAISLNRMHR